MKRQQGQQDQSSKVKGSNLNPNDHASQPSYPYQKLLAAHTNPTAGETSVNSLPSHYGDFWWKDNKGTLASSATTAQTSRPLESKPSEQPLVVNWLKTNFSQEKKKSPLDQHPKLAYFLVSLTGGNGSLSASSSGGRLGRPITPTLNQFKAHGTKIRSLQWAEIEDSQSLDANPRLVKSPKLTEWVDHLPKDSLLGLFQMAIMLQARNTTAACFPLNLGTSNKGHNVQKSKWVMK